MVHSAATTTAAGLPVEFAGTTAAATDDHGIHAGYSGRNGE
jgi:hypothetical protein